MWPTPHASDNLKTTADSSPPSPFPQKFPPSPSTFVMDPPPCSYDPPPSPDSDDSGRPPHRPPYYNHSYGEKRLVRLLEDIHDDMDCKWLPPRPTGPSSSLRQLVNLPLDPSAQFPGPFTPPTLLKNAITEDSPDAYQIPIDQRVIDWSNMYALQWDPSLRDLLRPICQDRLALANGIREVTLLGYLNGISEPDNPEFLIHFQHYDPWTVSTRLIGRIRWALTNLSAGAEYYFTYRAKLTYSLSLKHPPPPCRVNRPSQPRWEDI
ncbi:uncharacterized protein STEHIDRAFT_159303 [Stereum hirsutum FP-91666 SS1]|uniref:uncharacterized protein n=1 Tax=Stereum hirsutum (strain FP-91666) TaxID=721885 RepID=UPI000444A6E5|nr:uncharacterized protein STEHIDRAFT_159303 [Stereum hirsutum FP-91666 SS1]EIM84640.1 hypothetical protein STEHIDRAFT_159303 [Stereum hirsutum FP-91666 SS1]